MIILQFIICAVLAFAFTASPYYLETGSCKFSLGYLFSAVVCFFAFTVLFRLFKKLVEKMGRQKRIASGSCFFESKYGLLKLTALMFLIWLPSLVCLYPGTAINDTWGQLAQYKYFISNTGVLDNHHPIFDTLLMGIMIVPLSELTGEWHAVMFVYTLIQSAMTCLSFSCIVKYAYEKLDIGQPSAMGMFLFFCLMPFYPAAAQTISKDALFSWIYAFFAIEFTEVIRTEGRVLLEKKELTKLTLLCVLCCLTKKVGTYVVVLSLLVALFFLKYGRKRLLCPLLCSGILMFALIPFLVSMTDITPGGKQEIFSIPFQQTARYVKVHPDDVSDWEYIVIDDLLNMEDLADRYTPLSADRVKGYHERGTSEQYLQYLRVWLIQGIRHPWTYLSAFNAMLAGWFSWSEYIPLTDMSWHSQLKTALLPEWLPVRPDFSNVTAAAFKEYFDGLWNNALLKPLLSYGLYASVIPAFIVIILLSNRYRIRKKYWLAALPLILSIILGCWLAPLSTHFEGRRYLYPVIYSEPLMIAWCVYAEKSDKLPTANS